eukprot:SAG25_NODE_2613_length_1490_cov_1.311287_1_plen_58_part_10
MLPHFHTPTAVRVLHENGAEHYIYDCAMGSDGGRVVSSSAEGTVHVDNMRSAPPTTQV